MSTDRSLATLLRALQSPSASPDDSGRLLSSATTLLTLLTNPLNLTLLTSHLLTAPAIWSSLSPNSSDIRTSLRVLSSFYNAANHILHREDQPVPNAEGFLAAEGLPREEWIRAVVKGADDKSARWKHLIVLGGLLTGFEAHERQCLPLKLRELLESAIVTAVNLSLEAEEEGSHQDRLTILIVLAHSFDLLSVHEKLKLNAFRLLPVLMSAVYFSKEGLHRGYFLGTMDSDIVQGKQNKFNWSERSASFYQVQHIATGPILSTLGSLSKLTAFCVESVLDTSLVFNVLDDLTAFSRSLSVQWRQNKLSELDASEEELFLAADALERTLPLLWQVLKSAMFSVVIVQSALISRSLRDPRMPRDKLLYVAVSSLRTLRNLYFISSRLGHNSFSQFNFVFNASIDMLTKYPAQLQDFMLEISPKNFGGIPDHPQERCHDLFFLNTAEHVALESSPEQCEQLYLGAAGPYLGMGGDLRLNEIFEAAHSVVLAVFSAPQNFEITTQRLPSYIDTLFQVFPSTLSPRQFRLAIKTLVRTASPPSRIAEAQPLLATTLLEMVRHRALTTASTNPLPPIPSHEDQTQPLSEQATLILAIIDSLPCISLPNLEEWLYLAAESLNSINDDLMKEECKKRYWEVLSNGEMDMVRAELCVHWWHDRGGKNFVTRGIASAAREDKGPFMSGALGEVAKI